jgi:hypothetical protein
MTTISVPMSQAISGVTLNVVVTGARRARTRLWLGTQIMRFAAAVIGCSVDVTTAAGRAAPPQLAPLIRLPRDEVRIEPLSDTHLAVALYTRGGSLYWQKQALHDLPNDLIGIEDLERHGVLEIYVSAVEKLIGARSDMLLSGAV